MPDRLHVRVAHTLENIGNRPLRLLDVRLPEESAAGSRNLRITIGGKQVSPQQTGDADGKLLRMPFDPAWEPRQSREIVTELDVTSDSSGRDMVAASAAAFYIAGESAV